MKPVERFLKKPSSFWASVRSLSQHLGYSQGDTILVPTVQQMSNALSELNLDGTKVLNAGKPTELGSELSDYFSTRSKMLTEHARANLMDVAKAKQLYDKLHKELKPRCPLPMNKQKGIKKAPAYLTCIINMMIEKHSKGSTCDYDPRELTTVTRDGEPLRTLARRVDGAFPSTINPIAIWEVKEYYYTTSFGSRIADGVYESLLDGMELEELREHEGIDVKHYLMVDAYDTWWNDGKAYLCRIHDMLHMGYVDEVLFGGEVESELPRIVEYWKQLSEKRGEPGLPEDRG